MDRRKKEAMRQKAMLRAHMELEQKHSRMNLLKIQNQWRKIMRLAKVQSLRKDIDVLAQSHERDVDRKDAIIQMLDRDLEEAEEQYQMALRSHLQNVERLISLQDSRLLALENEFSTELETTQKEFSGEREMITKQHTRERQELNDIISAVVREEIRNKNLEDINVLRITLEGTIEELERHFEEAHMTYLQNTDQQTQEFKNLTRKDQEKSKEIDQKIRKIERLQAARNHWQTKINQNAKECKERNDALGEEKNQISAHFQELKSRMNRFRRTQAKRLAALTKNARRCKARLTEKKELAERILKLAELARKLETEQEKVLPFSDISDQLSSDEEAMVAQQSAELKAVMVNKDGDGADVSPFSSTAVDAEGKPVEEWNYLDNFYKKFNKVMLDKLAVEREKERLEKENQDLQSILKQYLDGISINKEVMDANNPLLVVNGRVRLNRPPVRRGVKPVTVDANQMVATGRINTGPLGFG